MKQITMMWKAFKNYLLQILLFFFASCQSSDKNYFVHGNDCKLWLLFDNSITKSGKTPYILCFDKDQYGCYLIQSNGALKKRFNGDVVYSLIEGGVWKIKKDSLFINDIGVLPGENIKEDTLKIKENIYLINVTNKYFIKNCDSKNLIANFKGEAIDSINDILNYKEQEER